MNTEQKQKILIVGATATSSLELSYARAASALGFEVKHFDPDKETGKHIRLGKIGQTIHRFLPVDAWIRKMNRELIVSVKEYTPDIILLFTNARILYGTLATIKTISAARLVWIWPDTPMNLAPQNAEAAGLYDLSAVYSEKALPVFQQLGFANTSWVPLAGDPFMHGKDPVTDGKFDVDLSFVGMWRPERERALSAIAGNFKDLKIELYGSYWKEKCTNKELLKCWKGSGIVGSALGQYFNKSRVNLNVIDDTNYPAANMRFFEIGAAGGLQLTSPCPEMENVFRHRQELVYFTTEQDCLAQVEWIFQNPEHCQQLRVQAHQLISSGHSYVHRLQKILREL